MDMNYFTERRSRRRFTDQEIPRELLESIVACAMRAPTTGNMQLYSIIVSRKGDGRKALEELHFNQSAATGADVLLTVCADFNRFSRWATASGADPGYDNLLSLFSAMTDAIILAQQIVTIAEMEGLGSCYLGTVNYNASQIAELLELPEMVMPVACVALGYPADEGEPTERLETEAILYDEKYPAFTDEEILRLYATKDDYPANRRFIEENGKESLAQVFTDIRYPRSMNESVSEALFEYLKNYGFLPSGPKKS